MQNSGTSWVCGLGLIYKHGPDHEFEVHIPRKQFSSNSIFFKWHPYFITSLIWLWLCHKVGSDDKLDMYQMLIMYQKIPMTPLEHLNIIPSSLIPNPLLDHGVSDLAVSYRSVLM
jgi:hypothetical protein